MNRQIGAPRAVRRLLDDVEADLAVRVHVRVEQRRDKPAPAPRAPRPPPNVSVSRTSENEHACRARCGASLGAERKR
jgi:hypothetical protein